MADEVTATYYAIVDDFSSRAEPGGVLRRIKDERGRRDEAFSRSLTWVRTGILYAWEHGDLTNRLYPITEEEAERIVERIRLGAPYEQ